MTASRPLPEPSLMFAARIARIVFGVVVLAGLVALIANTRPISLDAPARPSMAQIIGQTWFAATVAAAAAYVLTAALRLRLAPGALFIASLVVPVAAIALILPLTLHLLVALAIGGRTAAFDDWVTWSMITAGPAHLVFAAACMARAGGLATGDTTMTPFRIFAITVIAASIPFAVLIIPPVVVAITGLPILPLLYGMKPLIDHERDQIAALPGLLPRAAIVRRLR